VVFSYERAKADSSQLRAYANAAGIPKRSTTSPSSSSRPDQTIELEHVATINICQSLVRRTAA
jgi:hypothetical protein